MRKHEDKLRAEELAKRYKDVFAQVAKGIREGKWVEWQLRKLRASLQRECRCFVRWSVEGGTIEELELPLSTYRLLIENGFTTISELTSCTKYKLTTHAKLRPRDLEVIQEALGKRGLGLRVTKERKGDSR